MIYSNDSPTENEWISLKVWIKHVYIDNLLIIKKVDFKSHVENWNLLQIKQKKVG